MTDENVGGLALEKDISRMDLFFFQLEQVTHGLKSVQLDDENASKYFINYIGDESEGVGDDETNHHEQEHNDNHDFDVSSLPNSLIITPVPQDLFTNQELKVDLVIDSKICLGFLCILQDEFERLFRAHDSDITVLYLKFFQRVRITFTSPYNALQARLHLHEYDFHGTTIKTYFACVCQ